MINFFNYLILFALTFKWSLWRARNIVIGIQALYRCYVSHYIALYLSVMYYIALCIAMYCIAVYCISSDSIKLYCMVLYCIVLHLLYCILYYIVLHCIICTHTHIIHPTPPTLKNHTHPPTYKITSLFETPRYWVSTIARWF